MSAPPEDWFLVQNAEEIPSPALLLYSDRIERNVRRMIELARDPSRLRPHIKTHKLPELVRRQVELGIAKFKTATIAESEMAAAAGAKDVLLAYQPVGPNVPRLLELMRRFAGTRFSVIADDAGVLRNLSSSCTAAKLQLDVLLDVDCGMHRTGIAPGSAAVALYQLLAQLPGVAPAGLHAYDGHLHQPNRSERERECELAFRPVLELREQLLKVGLPVPRIVAGGTPTFPFHAARPGVECSPGTCVLWDAGYGSKLQDLDFVPAALLLTRVVSKPGPNRLCLDLGHKAVASENPHPRVVLLGLEEARAVSHSEEHLVVETEQAGRIPIGACVYGVPWHVCPTVALYSEAMVVEGGESHASWKVVARRRHLTV